MKKRYFTCYWQIYLICEIGYVSRRWFNFMICVTRFSIMWRSWLPAEFLKWNNPSFIFRTVHYHFEGCQNENLKMVRSQYIAWSDCMNVQADLALYWWQRLITFISSRIRVKEIRLVQVQKPWIHWLVYYNVNKICGFFFVKI